MFFSFSLKSQENLTNNVRNKNIFYLSEIPDNKINNKSGFFEKLGNIVFGKKKLSFKKPMSVISDQSNTIWVSDVGSANLYKIKDGKVLLPNFVKKHKDKLKSPVGLSLYSEGRLLLTDSYLNTVFIFNEKSKEIQLFKTGLNQPTGIAYSRLSNEIYVVETSAHRISVFNEEGELIRTIGKRGISNGEFNYPTFIWVDNLGIIYVIDSLNFRIQLFDQTGKVISAFGKQGDGTGNFARPKGIAVDSKGNIYIADALFHVVQIFDRSGNFLHSFGSQGRGKGQFWMPTGIFIDENDLIYVADSYNSRIQVFKLQEEDK